MSAQISRLLDLNDVALGAYDTRGFAASPGFARFNGRAFEYGLEAQNVARRFPREISTRYWSQLNQLPRQQWAEYFDGPTGTWVGQQSRTYQTWTIVGFLLLHHFLRTSPEDVEILDLEELFGTGADNAEDSASESQP